MLERTTRLRTICTLAIRMGCWLALISTVLAPQAAWADACCRYQKSNSSDVVCLTIATGGCAAISQSTNQNLTGVTYSGDLGTANEGQCRLVAQGGICSALSDAVSYNPNPTAQPGASVSPGGPELNIPIPGLQFGAPVKNSAGQLAIPFLAQYVSAVYKYLLGVSVVAAAVMIVYGGFLYILGSTFESITNGKEYIANALIGLFLIFASYTLLNTLNPATVAPEAIPIDVVSADESWINDHGTGDPFASTNAQEHAAQDPIPGTPTPPGTYQPPAPPTPGQPPAPAVPAAPVVPVETVDISNIPFDKSLGGPANMNLYCTTKAEAAKATTYQDKIKLLVKAVLGWYKVCVTNHLCVYCQGCGTTIPGGKITAGALTTYIVNQATKRKMTEGLPENLWRGIPECIDAWNDPKKMFSVNSAASVCPGPAKAFYQKYFVNVFEENKLFAGDCGSFATNLYSCANAAWTRQPTEKAYDPNTKKTINTAYLSAKSLGKFNDIPNSILSAHMNEDLLGLAAKKGGMQFGDLVYTNGGATSGDYSAHWFMYTGGRPDVPFSFIEMGGVGASVGVPGIPGDLSTVDVKSPTWTIQDYVNSKTAPRQLKTTSGRVWATVPSTTDPTKGVIYVWRPYGDSPGAPGVPNNP